MITADIDIFKIKLNKILRDIIPYPAVLPQKQSIKQKNKQSAIIWLSYHVRILLVLLTLHSTDGSVVGHLRFVALLVLHRRRISTIRRVSS